MTYVEPFSAENVSSKGETQQDAQKLLDKFFSALYKGIAITDIILATCTTVMELAFIAFPNLYLDVYNAYNVRYEVISAEYPHESWKFVSFFIIGLFYLMFEGWMFEMLTKGSSKLDRRKLNVWVNVRAVLLVFLIIHILYRIFDKLFSLYDIIYVPIIMFRILELTLVKGLSSEMQKLQNNLSV